MLVKRVVLVERLDFSPLSLLLSALFDEWDSLKFDDEGFVINPLTGSSDSRLRISERSHRTENALYVFDELEEAQVDAGPAPVPVRFRLIADTHTQVALSYQSAPTASPEPGSWTSSLFGLLIEKHGWPRGSLSGEVEWLASDSRTVRHFIGRSGKGSIEYDFSGLSGADPTTFAEGKYRFGRMRVTGSVELSVVGEQWQFDGSVKVVGKGVARPLVFLSGPLVRRFSRSAIDEELSDIFGDRSDWELDLADLHEELIKTTDARTLVQSILWDPDFDDSHIMSRVAAQAGEPGDIAVAQVESPDNPGDSVDSSKR